MLTGSTHSGGARAGGRGKPPPSCAQSTSSALGEPPPWTPELGGRPQPRLSASWKLTLLQPRWPLRCSLNTPHLFAPQDLPGLLSLFPSLPSGCYANLTSEIFWPQPKREPITTYLKKKKKICFNLLKRLSKTWNFYLCLNPPLEWRQTFLSRLFLCLLEQCLALK